jgi:hypothetical protein
LIYAPLLFKKIREENKVSDSELMDSLLPENNREQIFKSNKKTASGITSNEGGNSGSFFFLSQDDKFLVITISSTEKNTLLNLLEDLHLHYGAQSGHSYISQILGLYSVKLKGFQTIQFIVIKNVVSGL